MSEFQKIIKYCAMGFAIFLAFGIITGIATAVLALTGVLGSGSSSGEAINVSKSFEDVKSITADNGVGEFIVKVGTDNKVLVEASNVNDDFVAKLNFSGNLTIKSKFNFWNFITGENGFGKHSKVIIYLPKDFVAENFEIDAGAGNVIIEALETKKLDINAGAGNIIGEYITAQKVKLDGGVGKITLEEVTLSDTDIDCGVGNVEIQGSLYGKNKIDCGIGEIDLELKGTTDDYNLKVDKGLGSIYINGKKHSDLNWNNMTADNYLDIDGGLGDINIDFNN